MLLLNAGPATPRIPSIGLYLVGEIGLAMKANINTLSGSPANPETKHEQFVRLIEKECDELRNE